MRRAIVLCVALLLQPAPPTVTIAWQGTAAHLTWSGLPRGACIDKGTTRLSDTCNSDGAHPDGSLLLTGARRDSAYGPRGGEVYAVVLSGHTLASATLPKLWYWMPRVVH